MHEIPEHHNPRLKSDVLFDGIVLIHADKMLVFWQSFVRVARVDSVEEETVLFST